MRAQTRIFQRPGNDSIMHSYSVRELCERMGTEAPAAIADRRIEGIATLENARENHVSFVQKEKYVPLAEKSAAGLLIVPRHLPVNHPNAVSVDHVMKRLLVLLGLYHPEPTHRAFVHHAAFVDPSAEVGQNVYLGAGVIVGPGARIGPGCRIEEFCVIGAETTIGENCWFSPRVTVQERCRIGRRVRLHPGVVIGADGFRFELIDGRPVKIPQVGTVVLEDDVEVGANTTIDRAFLEETRVGARTKIDNLVHIAHNVTIGSDCIIVAQVGIAGSARIGRGVMIGGQAGIKDHLRIGDGSRVAGHSAVQQNLPPGSEVIGFPATDLRNYARFSMFLRNFEKYWKHLRKSDRDGGA